MSDPSEIPKSGGFAAKSLFRNILHISPLNSKILRDFLRNSMILKDRGTSFFASFLYIYNMVNTL